MIPTFRFLQLDAQFKFWGITRDDVKFYAVVSAIDTEVLQSVREMVLKNLTDN